MPGRRRFLHGALAALAFSPAFSRGAAPPSFADDFDTFWRAIDSAYPYFERGHDWRGARTRWRPRAAQARSARDLLAALEGALGELADEGASLDAHAAGSPRPLPAGTDLWGDWAGAEARLTAVRAGSVADVAGAVPGMRILAIRGLPVEEAVRALLRRERQGDPRARNWSLRQLLAGPWSGTFTLEVSHGGRARRLEIERQDAPPAATPPLIARRIGENRDLGYLRIKNNLGDRGLLPPFDAALQHLRDTRGLVLDLRETPAGGSAEVARAVLARFTATESPWIVRAPQDRVRGTETPPERVAPRGPFIYAGPLAVLVDAWTAGEGESLAAGLDAVARATLVGTRMAGLRGDSRAVRLPASGITVRFPASRVFHPDGTPREALRPTLPVDIVNPAGGPGDPILYQALKLLDGRPPATRRTPG